MSTSRGGSLPVDNARQILCDEIARCLRERKFSVRVRITEAEGKAAEVWFYFHAKRGWHKEPQVIREQPLVEAINESLEMLSSKEHHDAWSARRHSHSNVHDTDLQFHVDKLAEHPDDQLESVVMGLLFRDQHDSKKDSRRNIRTNRPTQPRR